MPGRGILALKFPVHPCWTVCLSTKQVVQTYADLQYTIGRRQATISIGLGKGARRVELVLLMLKSEKKGEWPQSGIDEVVVVDEAVVKS